MNRLLANLTRLAIKTGRWPGPAGAAGRLVGRRFGAPMGCGLRLVVHDPREYIQRCILARGVYEPGIAEAIAALLVPGDVFFDVGANIGNHTLGAASIGANVHAFEPMPRLADALRENVAFNRVGDRVRVVQAAAGPAAGTASLHVAAGRGDDGSHSLLLGSAPAGGDSVEVAVVTLDEHAAAAGIAPDLIKIDVEGFEARVLDGATRLLDASPGPAVIVETGDRMADQIGESAASVLGRFFARGYRVFALAEDRLRLSELAAAAHVPGELRNYLAARPGSPALARLLKRAGLPTEPGP